MLVLPVAMRDSIQRGLGAPPTVALPARSFRAEYIKGGRWDGFVVTSYTHREPAPLLVSLSEPPESSSPTASPPLHQHQKDILNKVRRAPVSTLRHVPEARYAVTPDRQTVQEWIAGYRKAVQADLPDGAMQHAAAQAAAQEALNTATLPPVSSRYTAVALSPEEYRKRVQNREDPARLRPQVIADQTEFSAFHGRMVRRMRTFYPTGCWIPPADESQRVTSMLVSRQDGTEVHTTQYL